jgi:hypothetical protein
MRHIIFALELLVFGLAVCQAGDLPTPEEVAAIVREGGFGPVIGAEPPGDGYTLTSLTSRTVTIEDNTSGMWWINQNEAWVTDAYPSEDGKYFFVVFRAPGMVSYGYEPPWDAVWRSVYGVRDGKITFLGRQYGKLKKERETVDFEPFCETGDCEED